MTTQSWPRGLVTALVTPLQDDEIDGAALKQLIDYQVQAGASGIVVSGGTGEYGFLTFEERSQLICEAIKGADGRIPVIAATGCLSTRDTISLSRVAEAGGAHGLLLVSSYGEAISWTERQAFYADVATAVSLPIMLYNTPPAGLLSFDQIKQLAEIDGISAVKDSSGDAELMSDLTQWAQGRDFGVYVGKDSFLFEAMTVGADGAVFGAANFIPAELSGFIKNAQAAHDIDGLRAAWATLRCLLRLMEQATNYVGLCKAGLKLRGIDVGSVRKPYLMPESSEVAMLKFALDQLV